METKPAASRVARGRSQRAEPAAPSPALLFRGSPWQEGAFCLQSSLSLSARSLGRGRWGPRGGEHSAPFPFLAQGGTPLGWGRQGEPGPKRGSEKGESWSLLPPTPQR